MLGTSELKNSCPVKDEILIGTIIVKQLLKTKYETGVKN